MFKNYLKLTMRNIKKHKGFSFINIFGFSIGMACCILILIWVQDELSYDRHHENADRICRVAFAMGRGDNLTHYAKAPWVAAKAFSDEVPGIESYVRILTLTGQLAYLDNKFDNLNILYAEQAYFEIFSHKFIKGNAFDVLTEPGSVVLTEETAYKLFGSVDPIGKTLKLNQTDDLEVTGVIKNVPGNSHFRFDFAVSMSTRYEPSGGIFNSWGDITGWSYILLAEGVNMNEVENKIPGLVEKYCGEAAKRMGMNVEFYLQKLTDIHLRSHLRVELETNSDIYYVYIFSATAFIILIIACINFMNLSTARSANRKREVGLRKVFGANRKNLVRQFMGESAIMTAIGILIAIVIVIIALPAFNNITGKEFNLQIFMNSSFLINIVFLLILTGVLSGSYPAFFLSSFQPAEVLRAQFSKIQSRSFLRNILVVFQFVISIVLITCTIIMLKQINYMKDRNLGFDKEQILVLRIRQNILLKTEIFKNEIKQNPAVVEATYSSGVPGRRRLVFSVEKESNTEKIFFLYTIFSDLDFLNTFKFELLDGRDFSKDLATDVSDVYLVNETAQRELGWGNETVGKRIRIAGQNFGPIIGVIKDFHFESVKKTINPLVICPSRRNNIYLSMKLKTENMSETISFIENKWKEFEPERDFNYFFVDENFDAFYANEERTREILNYFSFFTIFISCLGLFGLVSFTAERLTKEIGIRKVLGAGISSIIILLSKNFIKLVIVSSLIASPIVYFAMKKWLENFAYRTNIGIFEFILSAIIALLIALATVSYQAIKAAMSNPVDSLRNE